MGDDGRSKLGSLSAKGNVLRTVQNQWKAAVEKFRNDRVLGRQAAPA